MGTTEEAIANAEKLGFKTNIVVEHPFLKNKTLPVYIANFVLMDWMEQFLGVQLMIRGI